MLGSPRTEPPRAPRPCPHGMKDAFSCSEWICWETTDFLQLGNIWLAFLRLLCNYPYYLIRTHFILFYGQFFSPSLPAPPTTIAQAHGRFPN